MPEMVGQFSWLVKRFRVTDDRPAWKRISIGPKAKCGQVDNCRKYSPSVSSALLLCNRAATGLECNCSAAAATFCMLISPCVYTMRNSSPPAGVKSLNGATETERLLCLSVRVSAEFGQGQSLCLISTSISYSLALRMALQLRGKKCHASGPLLISSILHSAAKTLL